MRYTKFGRLNMPTARLLALPSLFAVTLALASPAAAASLGHAGLAAGSRPAVEICGQGPAVTRPASMVLTCADGGEIDRKSVV